MIHIAVVQGAYDRDRYAARRKLIDRADRPLKAPFLPEAVMYAFRAVQRYGDRLDPGLLQFADQRVCKQKSVGDNGHTDPAICERFHNDGPVAPHEDFTADQRGASASELCQLIRHIQAFLSRQFVLPGSSCS